MRKRIKGLHHVALFPIEKQYDRTVQLYTKILGLRVMKRWGDKKHPCMMVACGNGVCIEIIPGEIGAGLGGPIKHMAFSVGEDLDELFETVREAGYMTVTEPQDIELCGRPVRNAFFRGATGERVELFWEK